MSPTITPVIISWGDCYAHLISHSPSLAAEEENNGSNLQHQCFMMYERKSRLCFVYGEQSTEQKIGRRAVESP